MAHLLSYRCGSLQNPHLPLARIAEIGIQGLELVWNDETTVDGVKAAIDPHDLQVTSLHAPCPLDDDDLPALLGRHAECAAALGAAYLFVSTSSGDMPRQEAYARLRRAGDAVGAHQVYLAMETHLDLCHNAAAMLETMEGVNHPWVGVNFDTANLYYYNEAIDAVDQARKAGAHVRGMHLKDTFGGFREGNFPVLGEGIVNFAAVDQVLTAAGYQGAYCMELEGGTFDASKPDELADKVRRCAEHLRQVGVVG